MTQRDEQPQWRLMREQDLAQVDVVANIVHPDFFEEEAVFRDRFNACPEGCFVLDNGTEILGYGISHPWSQDSIPELNKVYGDWRGDSDVFYIHDVALLPKARSGGQASRVIAKMIAQASELHFPTMALVAVNGTQGFWQKQGFTPKNVPSLALKLRTYSDDAVYMIRKS